MKSFPNSVQLVESVSELPNFTGADNLYLDFETTSGDPKKTSTNPWHNCDIAGIGVTVDDCPMAYYIPIKGAYQGEKNRNLSLDSVHGWLYTIMKSTKRWINHNIKYDAHVFCNCMGPGNVNDLPVLIDTLALSKLVDSDRMYRGGYGLDILSKDWLSEDISRYQDALNPYLKTSTGQWCNKDYGNIPIDVIAPYGGQDVLTVRKLANYIRIHIPDESRDVMNTECILTFILFTMERMGVIIDKTELQIHQLYCLTKMAEIQEELTEEVGHYFLPSSNKQVQDVLVNTYGLPILSYNEDSNNPSFDKEALIEYLKWPDSPKNVVKNITEHRKHHHFNGLFIEKYLELASSYTLLYDYMHNGNDSLSYLHPDINQTVSTGRMSCRNPNMQQLNKRAKYLIHPPKDWMFISIDYSQIEFRLIINYIRNIEAIAAYKKDPDTDFHSWVQSKLPGDISRTRAKTINFSMGYGTGRKGMGKNMDLMEDLREQAGTNRAYFLSLCSRRGAEIYDMYHAKFPELKQTSKYYENMARSMGYVTNLHGRRRHLDPKVAHIAFNTVNQGDAADIMKERLVAVSQVAGPLGVYPLIPVHDEILFTCPIEIGKDPCVITKLVQCLESPRIQDKLFVPIRCKVGVSEKSWADCGEDEFTIPYREKEKV